MQHVEGQDSRKWRIVSAALPCKECGKQPIAAKSSAGWTLQCPTDHHHGYHFEQWLPKCVRKWDHFQKPA
jgi:hypothetical protein